MVSVIEIASSEHRIKSVSVYKSSKAEVVRTFEFELKSGTNKININGLPTVIDTHSLRVSGLTPNVRLSDVTCTLGNRDENSIVASDRMRELKIKKANLESEKRVREHEADILVTYAKTLTGEHVAPEVMEKFLKSFVEQGRHNLDAVTSINEKIHEVERLIEKEKEKNALKKGSTNATVSVVLFSDTATKASMTLTYIVSNAHWDPTYELHAKTVGGKPSPDVALHYRARVTQSTGEDWKDTSLTLSNVSLDAFQKAIPTVDKIRIFARQANRYGSAFGQTTSMQKGGGLFGNNTAMASNTIPNISRPFQQAQQQQQQLQQQQQQQGTSAFGAFGGSAFGTFGTFGTTTAGSQPAFQQAAAADSAPLPTQDAADALIDSFEEIDINTGILPPEAATIVKETPLAISYSVEGLSTIPSDDVAHQVEMAVLSFETQISHVVIPRKDPRVFLQCQVKNTTEYRLLPGPVSVILDESLVSKTSINDINTGDTFVCTLGDDTSTKVRYTRTSKFSKSPGGTFSEVFNTTTYNTKTTIYNKHTFPISDLVIRDVVPHCEDKRIKVILRKPEGLADSKGSTVNVGKDGLKAYWQKGADGANGESEGKFEWKWKVDAGSQVVVETEWEVKAPADLPLTEAPV